MKKTRQILFLFVLSLISFSGFSAPSPAHAQTDRIFFAVIGDFGVVGQPAADVATLVKSWNPDFIATTGDNNQNDRPNELDDNIGQYYHEYLVNYTGKYGEGSPTRRFFPSPGNHDWAGDGLKSYLKFFDMRPYQRYYEFVQGPVHFFMIDSDRNEPDGTDAKSEQATWLRKALAASTSPFQVVMFHHPPYTSGWHRPSQYMRWPFKEWGADIVLTGHNHLYERLSVDGLTYITNGLGGAEIYKFETAIPESIVRFNQDHGAMRVEATRTYMKFQMFTRTGILVDEYLLGQGNPSVLSVTNLTASPTNADLVNFQVSFSEAVSGVDLADFSLATNLTGATITAVNGTGNSYTVTVNTGSGDGALRLDVGDDDTIINSVGNPLGGYDAGNGNFNSSAEIIVDNTAPAVVSVLRSGQNPTNASSVDYSVTFSEPVMGLDTADFGLTSNTGAQLTGLSGVGNFYTVSVTTGLGNDELRLDFIDNDSVMDLAGNLTAQNTQGEVYSIDRTPPTALSISRAGAPSVSGADYTVRFSEPVTGVDGGDFFLATINGAAIKSVSGGGELYTVSILLNPGSDAVRLDLKDNDSIFDHLGNPLGGIGLENGNSFGETIPIAIDTPIVTSIIRASTNPTSAASVDFIVTFSETVNGVDASDFSISGKSDASIQSVRAINPFYIVTVNSGALDGDLKVSLIDDDSIHNPQGIALGGNGPSNGNFSNGEFFTIDRTLPRATSIIRAGNNPAITPSVDFIVTFSEPVINVDASDFWVATTNLGATITKIQNVDPFYVITVNTGAGSGVIGLDLLDNRSISDRAGNLLADNGTGNGSFTSGEEFTLAKIPVDFPAPAITAVNRANLINLAKPTITWSAVWNALAYEIFIARDSSFSELVTIQTIQDVSFTPTSPLADGTYFIKVWAFNADRNPGKFSKPYSFTIDTTPPTPPTPVSPTKASTTSKRPWLVWTGESGIWQYLVEVDNNPDFSSPEFSGATNKSTIQTKILLSGRTYYWRVRAVDAAGNWSNWSAVFSMTSR